MSTLNRRTFLQAAGLAAGSLFLPSLSRAQGIGGRPKRVVFMMTELGWNPASFRMAPPGAPAELLLRSDYHPLYKNQPDPWRWELDLRNTPQEDFSPTLAPLFPIRDKVLALDGLGMLSIGADSLGDAHARAWNHALSGYPAGTYITGQRALGGKRSLDMQIANFLRQQSPHLTDLTALHFYLGQAYWGGGVNTFHHFFYDRGPSDEIIKVPTMSDPREVFSRLFPGGAVPGEEVNPLDAGQRNVLDVLHQRYSALYPNLGREDRQKLDLHQQLISDIQARLVALDNISCQAPAQPTDINSLMPAEALDANIESFFRMAAVAMSCDLSRVVCMQYPNQGGILNPVYGANDRDFHEWYSHGTNPPNRWFGQENARVSQDEYDRYLDAAPVLANKNRFHVSQAVRFAQMLAEIPDGEGSLLDNTLIVLMDEISHGSHGHDQWPVVLIGDLGGTFRTGRYIRFPRVNPRPAINAQGNYVGVPHSHLLVSILQGMGMQTNSLGLDSVYARVPGEQGRYIDLTGPLQELT
jgi:hypothetical protein